MDIINKEITISKQVFVANDGTEFFTERQCKAYEETAEAVINARFSSRFNYNCQDGNGVWAYSLYLCCCDGEDELSCFIPMNQDDLDILNMFIMQHGESKPVDSKYIGQKLIFICRDGEYSFVGSEEEVRKQLDWNLKCITSNHIPICDDCINYDKESNKCPHRNCLWHDGCYRYEERTK